MRGRVRPCSRCGPDTCRRGSRSGFTDWHGDCQTERWMRGRCRGTALPGGPSGPFGRDEEPSHGRTCQTRTVRSGKRTRVNRYPDGPPRSFFCFSTYGPDLCRKNPASGRRPQTRRQAPADLPGLDAGSPARSGEERLPEYSVHQYGLWFVVTWAQSSFSTVLAQPPCGGRALEAIHFAPTRRARMTKPGERTKKSGPEAACLSASGRTVPLLSRGRSG